MLAKYLIPIFIAVLINNAIGENEEMPSAWKTEIEKTFDNKLLIEQNKLKEKLEERSEKQYQKLEIKLEENKKKLNEELGKALEVTVEDNLGEQFERKLAVNLVKKLQGTLEDNLEKKLEENLREQFKTKLEEELGKKLEVTLGNNLGEKLETKLEVNLVKKFAKLLQKNLEKNLEENLREKLKTELEDNLGKILEGKLEKNLQHKLEAKLEDNLGNKLERKLEKIFEDTFVKKQNSDGEWITTTLTNAISLSGRAVVGGYENDGNPLWVVRSSIPNHDNLLIPGKLNVNGQVAYFPYNMKEFGLTHGHDITEVFCAPPEKVRWVECRNGFVPTNAVIAAHTSGGEKLYVGRAKEQGTLTPGKVHPSHKHLYIAFNEKEIAHSIYEVLCLV